MMPQSDLIVFSPTTTGPWASTLSWLRNRGWRVQAVDSAALDMELRRNRKAPLLIYSPASGAPAADVVSRASDAIHGRPVVVAVDSSDFGAYYELMALGVRGYYEIGEGPESIGRALQHFCAAS